MFDVANLKSGMKTYNNEGTEQTHINTTMFKRLIISMFFTLYTYEDNKKFG